jgi:hypothetical protein
MLSVLVFLLDRYEQHWLADLAVYVPLIISIFYMTESMSDGFQFGSLKSSFHGEPYVHGSIVHVGKVRTILVG